MADVANWTSAWAKHVSEKTCLRVSPQRRNLNGHGEDFAGCGSGTEFAGCILSGLVAQTSSLNKKFVSRITLTKVCSSGHVGVNTFLGG